MKGNHKNRKTVQKEKITVLVVEPMKEPYVKIIDKGTKSLQSEVNGHIEAIFPFDDPVAIVLNNDGKYQGLAWNRGLYDGTGELCDVIAGTFLVIGVKGEDLISLSEELAAKYMEKYKIPEEFIFHPEDGMENGLKNEGCRSKEENAGKYRKKRRVYEER